MQACKHLHDPGTTVNKIMEPAQSQGKCKKNVSQKKRGMKSFNDSQLNVPF